MTGFFGRPSSADIVHATEGARTVCRYDKEAERSAGVIRSHIDARISTLSVETQWTYSPKMLGFSIDTLQAVAGLVHYADKGKCSTDW